MADDQQIADFLRPGTETQVGSAHFSADDIIRFAEKFHPIPMHTNADIHGSLTASNLHVVSAWMKLQRSSVAENTKRLKQSRQAWPEFGPSPGMNHLVWPNPVYSGDTITYKNIISELRQSNSRQGWYVMRTKTQGVNQKLEQVLSFESTVFVTFHSSSTSVD